MADGRDAPISRGLEKTVGVASHVVGQSSINSSCIYLPSSNSTMEIEDNGWVTRDYYSVLLSFSNLWLIMRHMIPNSLQVPFLCLNPQQGAWRMNVGTFLPSVASRGDDGHATTLETKWDERLK